MSTPFRGVLVRPVDQQADRDGLRIDPRGISFDPERWYLVTPEFRSDLPPVGRVRVHLDDSGALVAEGELFDAAVGAQLAFGGTVDKEEIPQGLITSARLLIVGLTDRHADPEQPSITLMPKDGDREAESPPAEGDDADGGVDSAS